MKTKIHYIVALMVLTITTGCGNSWLNLSPNTSIDSDEAIQELRDLEFALNGIYSTMQSGNYYGGQMTYFGDIAADDMMSYKTTSSGASFYLYKYNKDNATNSFWSVYYTLSKNIAIAMNAMEEIEMDIVADREFTTPGGRVTTEGEFYNELRGQALAIRALALFDMTRLYGYPYMKDQGASLSVPIVTDVVDMDYKPSRNTVKESYEVILIDLNEAVSIINEKPRDGRLNKWAVYTLLSRVHLYMGNDDLALDAAEKGIQGALNHGFGLLDNDEYAGAWSKPFNKEFIFEIVNLTTDSPGKSSVGYYYRRYNMIATNKFFKNKLAKSNDVRKALVSTASSRRPFCMKFPEQDGKSYEDCNVVVFRMSELYLNAAEAAVKLGNNTKALEYFLPIYKRTNEVWQASEVTMDDILEQRRVEFWGEGHRFFDLMRNNQRIERTDYLDAVPMDARSFDWDFYRIVLPIPRKETNLNENIQQNPGYGD